MMCVRMIMVIIFGTKYEVFAEWKLKFKILKIINMYVYIPVDLFKEIITRLD